MKRLLLILLMACLLTACPGRALNSATKKVAEGLSTAILNQNDIPTAQDGLPSYLLVVDGLIVSSPENADLLGAGARLYSTYADNFTSDPDRAQRLTQKARDYGRRMLCLDLADLCEKLDKPIEDFQKELDKSEGKDVPALYGFGAAWASWVQARSNDWGAIADLPRIKAIMEKVVQLDETYEHGNAHLYLGVLATQLPPNLGGKPEDGRLHFERAIRISNGQNLIAKVLYARQYARLVFDRQLHDRLVQEVLDAPVEVDGLTLSNTIAKQQALILQSTADDYF